jgi:succinoglycan biosynthesis transport protein ExoP
LKANKELGVRDVVSLYRRRRRIFWIVLLLLVVATTTYVFVATPYYQAIGTLQVQPTEQDELNLDSLTGSASQGSGMSQGDEMIATQANILQSQTLALQAINKVHLDKSDQFNPKTGFIKRMFGAKDEPRNKSLENSPARRTYAMKVFSGNLTVKQITGTDVLEVDYLDPDAGVSAAIVNSLMQGLIDYNFQTKFNATSQASTWLSSQLADIRQQAEDMNKKVADLQRKSGIVDTGLTDPTGKPEAYSATLDELQQATLAYQQAQQASILKGAIARAAASGDAEMLSGLAGNTPTATMVASSLTVVQALRQTEAQELAGLKDAEAKFGPAYPRLNQLRNSLDATRDAITREVQRVRERAQSDYSIAQHVEVLAKAHFDAARVKAEALNNDAIDFVIAKREADDTDQLYSDLTKRLKEAGVLEGLKSTNISIIDPGRPPADPARPFTIALIAASILGGVIFGFLASLIADVLDNKIHTVATLEEDLGATMLGVLPKLAVTGPNLGLPVTIQEPLSTYAESIRTIRTSLMLSRGDGAPRIILVTSSIAGEGKTTVSSNLASVMSQSGKRVLLMDGDLRRSTLRRVFKITSSAGLSTLLAGQSNKPEFHVLPEIPNLSILTAGPVPPNAADLLGSAAMRHWLERWREEFDCVIIDGTPLLPVTDAMILNEHVDATLIVVRADFTQNSQVARSMQMLRNGTHHYIGPILNGLSASDDHYYNYYGYSDYRQVAYDKENE